MFWTPDSLKALEAKFDLETATEVPDLPMDEQTDKVAADFQRFHFQQGMFLV